MKIIIIDDEINRNIVKNILVKKIYLSGCRLQKNSCEMTHSTRIASILEQVAKVEFEIINIVIMGKEKKTTINMLKEALKVCCDLEGEIICMSLGTNRISEYTYIKDEIERLDQKGILIVAALSNNYHMTLPACLPKVLGVRYDFMETLPLNSLIYSYNDLLNIEMVVQCDFTQFGDGILPSNSFALPILIGKILNKCKKDDLKQKEQVAVKVCDKKITYCEDYIELLSPLEKNIPICVVQIQKDNDISFIRKVIDHIIESYSYETVGVALEPINCDSGMVSLFGGFENNYKMIKNITASLEADIIFLVYKSHEEIINTGLDISTNIKVMIDMKGIRVSSVKKGKVKQEKIFYFKGERAASKLGDEIIDMIMKL